MNAADPAERITYADLNLHGRSGPFLAALRGLRDVARSDVNVLVSGETGTGKELVARAVHALGPRAAGGFVAVNCGAVPDQLLADELFGHERGAFTDAHQYRPGLVAQADRGTIFFDEVDSLSGKAQVSLLRFLQERRYRPLGGTVERPADVRVVAASNAALDKLVAAGAFRVDLYYRLCVFHVHLPPLRDRPDDILPLAHTFIAKYGRSNTVLEADAARAVTSYDWPGNVRELENAIHRACVLCRGGRIAAPDLGLPGSLTGSPSFLDSEPANGRPAKPYRDQKREVLARFELDYLTRLMRDHFGNVSSAARAAGKDRRELGKMLKRCGIDPRQFLLPRVLRIG